MSQTAQSPELQSKIATWRAKIADGTITMDDLKEAVATMRQGRIGAAYASETAQRKKAKVAIPDANDLLSELEGL